MKYPERNFFPEAKYADAPKSMKFTAGSSIASYGVAKPLKDSIHIPSMLGAIPQSNPLSVSLPLHGAPNDVKNRGLRISGQMGHFHTSTMSAKPSFITLKGLGPDNMMPKKSVLLNTNY